MTDDEEIMLTPDDLDLIKYVQGRGEENKKRLDGEREVERFYQMYPFLRPPTAVEQLYETYNFLRRDDK